MQIDDTPAVRARFWAKVDRNGPPPAHCPDLGPCWLWTASQKSDGYGQFQVPLRGGGWVAARAHRVSFALANDLPLDLAPLVCHACDTPLCVRPSHLFAGTRVDNIRDMVGKRRHKHGAQHPNAKLTEEDVRAILAIPPGAMSQVAIARKYRVARSLIQNIQEGRGWRHLK